MCWTSSHSPASERVAALIVASSSPFSVAAPDPLNATPPASAAITPSAYGLPRVRLCRGTVGASGASVAAEIIGEEYGA
ncbi:hypothetical protein GCM10023096_72800 [Nonomuraea ferruginea]